VTQRGGRRGGRRGLAERSGWGASCARDAGTIDELRVLDAQIGHGAVPQDRDRHAAALLRTPDRAAWATFVRRCGLGLGAAASLGGGVDLAAHPVGDLGFLSTPLFTSGVTVGCARAAAARGPRANRGSLAAVAGACAVGEHLLVIGCQRPRSIDAGAALVTWAALAPPLALASRTPAAFAAPNARLDLAAATWVGDRDPARLGHTIPALAVANAVLSGAAAGTRLAPVLRIAPPRLDAPRCVDYPFGNPPVVDPDLPPTRPRVPRAALAWRSTMNGRMTTAAVSAADRRVASLLAEMTRYDQEGGRWDALRPEERRARETLLRHLATDEVRSRRAQRDEAIADTREALRRARAGEVPGDDADLLRWVATLVEGRSVRGLARLAHQLLAGRAPVRPCTAATAKADLHAQVVYAAGVLLRDAGQLEPAYALFGWSYFFWNQEDRLPFDVRFPAPPAPWRCWIPKVGFPAVDRADWRCWDHVIGCGTQIDRAVLDDLGVPRRQQVLLEVHRELPYPIGALPRLQGGVAVVDDVCEGETSQRLARVYDADVIAVGHQHCVYGALVPVLEVPDPRAAVRRG
jgi:hypothetical protein